MTVETSTGIVGNTKKAERDATEERQRQEQRKIILHRLVIGGLTAGITLALWFGVEWSFFYRLLAASFLLLAARQTQKLADNAGLKGRPQWAPEVLRAAGYTTLIVALLWSGIGALTEKTVDFVDRCADGDCTWTKDIPAQTVQELEDRIPRVKGNLVTLAMGEKITVWIKNPVRIMNHSCHYLKVFPKGVFTLDDQVVYMNISPPIIGEWTRLTVHSVRDTSSSRPTGC